MEEQERKIIARARDGDAIAFELLVGAYQRKVYNQALRMVSNPEDAADITQEVFVKVWQGLSRFQGNSSFSTWLYRLTDNAVIDFFRREKKRQGDTALDDLPADGLLTVDPSPAPHEALEKKELHRALQDGLNSLSVDHRRVLVLREINGLTYQQIAETLDLDLGTVKSRIARARGSLAGFLRKSGNFSFSPPSKGTDRR